MKYCLIIIISNLLFFSSYANENQKFLLVTGCARSGTTFMATFLCASGLDIPHEAMGGDGIVEWHFSDEEMLKESDCSFEHIFHQVRNPLDVISSLYTNLTLVMKAKRNPKGAHSTIAPIFMRRVPQINEQDSLLIQCAKYWYYWNLKSEAIAEWRYRIEDLESELPELGRRLDWHFQPEILASLEKNINTWNKIERRVTWLELEVELPQELFLNLQEMALRYGYSPFD